MKIVKTYSHLNGEEFLIVHKNALYDEIKMAIAGVDASKFRIKQSKEKGRKGEMLYSPGDLNKEFGRVFGELGWMPESRQFFVSDDYTIVRTIEPMSYEDQREYLESIHAPLIRSYNQTDFVKENVAVEVQFGKYFAVTYDLFVKHLSFYSGGLIDVGVEIVPSKEMQKHMSLNPPYFEKEVYNVLRHGRTTPPVPIIMLGIEPEELAS
jgi:hypothetical protein